MTADNTIPCRLPSCSCIIQWSYSRVDTSLTMLTTRLHVFLKRLTASRQDCCTRGWERRGWQSSLGRPLSSSHTSDTWLTTQQSGDSHTKLSLPSGVADSLVGIFSHLDKPFTLGYSVSTCNHLPDPVTTILRRVSQALRIYSD